MSKLLHKLLLGSAVIAMVNLAHAQPTDASGAGSAPAASATSGAADHASGSSATSSSATGTSGAASASPTTSGSTAATTNPADSASNDPFVQRREEKQQAKEEYKAKKKAAREDKHAAKEEYKAEKKQADARLKASGAKPTVTQRMDGRETESFNSATPSSGK